ncbi:hypothetical protein [Methylobacterium sp. NEAU K]|uniref:hypothetical protein n=1 Tax=Methylobacterium sp. NEAU K TaxID=3064946 RepID=UPI0027340849|nr:hypothetical protein [Methylobacterium sp. NEAU K]MDP4004737.1 hypothetical protein [Methylobacterium sp. NEAU K]
MDAFDHTDRSTEAGQAIEPQISPEAVALWTALEADWRARDERTARLRAMRLTAGDDETI